MNKATAIDLVERARALAPLIRQEAGEIERTRRLTAPVVNALVDNGMYRALLPKSLGGAEAPLMTFMQMQEEIAKADASTAWCLGQCSVCAVISAYIDHDAADEIFNNAQGILAWGAINHDVRAEPGGYRANARWEFASGIRQASWLGAHVRITEADGTPRKKPDGSPEIRTILFPLSRRPSTTSGTRSGCAAPAPTPIRSTTSSSPKNSQHCATNHRRCAKKGRSTRSRPTRSTAWALPRLRSASPVRSSMRR